MQQCHNPAKKKKKKEKKKELMLGPRAPKIAPLKLTEENNFHVFLPFLYSRTSVAQTVRLIYHARLCRNRSCVPKKNWIAADL